MSTGKKKKIIKRYGVAKTLYFTKPALAKIEKAAKASGKKLSKYIESLHGF